jgi:predicted Zn-dependent protease
MPRMTNTFMLGGDKDPQEIIASVERGLYAVNFGGGEVDITSGKFVFSASEAYWIENGKVLYPVKGATLIGNGRRESYAHIPMPRMTNTYMLNGDKTQEEILASVKNGLYAVNFGGGQVDITSGKFVFSASEAYIIENGKLTYPVKGATSCLQTVPRAGVRPLSV